MIEPREPARQHFIFLVFSTMPLDCREAAPSILPGQAQPASIESVSDIPITANPNRLYSPITRPPGIHSEHGSIIMFAHFYHWNREAHAREGRVKRGTRQLDSTMITEGLDNDKYQHVRKELTFPIFLPSEVKICLCNRPQSSPLFFFSFTVRHRQCFLVSTFRTTDDLGHQVEDHRGIREVYLI